MDKLLLYIRQRPFVKMVIKFCVVGGFAAIINFSIYYSLTEVVGFWYIYSAIWSFFASAIFNFITNKFWTFKNKDRGKHIVNQLLKFSFVMTTGILMNTGFIYMFTEWGGIDWKLSWVLATGLLTFWNFTLNRFWTFKHKTPSVEQEVPDLSVPKN